jgi:hypothetical protein
MASLGVSNKDMDYVETEGFSHFTDSKKFKYNEYGEILISTGSSSWANKLLNNMKIDDYFESEAVIPVIPTHFQQFENQKKIQKNKKESVKNLIEECEICNISFENYAHRLYYTAECYTDKLVCLSCFDYENNKIKCNDPECNNPNFATHMREINKGTGSIYEYEYYNMKYASLACHYCEVCIERIIEQDQQYPEEINEDICIQCGCDKPGGGICYYCRTER